MNERRNVRANLRLQVTLQGTDRFGSPFSILGDSVDFSRKGLGVTIGQDIVAPGSVVTVSSPDRFQSNATVQWIARDRESGSVRLGLKVNDVKARFGFRTAVALLLFAAFIMQVSFARSRNFARSSSRSSCVVSLEHMKATLSRTLKKQLLLSQSEKSFIHIQHQQMGCGEYTRQFEKTRFFSDGKKREAMTAWHWKVYHSEDAVVRAAVAHDCEVFLGMTTDGSGTVAADLESADVR